MTKPRYSIIIPVYNRPQEIDELLQSLTEQQFKDFEVLVIEDGSKERCDAVVEKYTGKLKLTYYFKPNTGQGFTRNFGFQKALGHYFIVFDSDCIIPVNYLEAVDNYLQQNRVDAFGGPDKALPSFTPMQRAISYSMTSLFTTGGIRGGEKRIGAFHPRSFNMGISREVFEKTNGYKITRMGEDIEFSIRIIKLGFSTALIPSAYVYHKRRTTLKQFYKQLHFFGRARINVGKFYPAEVKLVHCFPAFFTVSFLFMWVLPFVNFWLFVAGLCVFSVYFLLIFFDSLNIHKSVKIAFLSVGAAFTQLFAYGMGFFKQAFNSILKRG